MERVKVTQEQAELMEEVRGCASVSELCYERCLNGSWIGVFKPLNELNADEFARALYIGYEVEPSLKIGDWVIRDDHGTIGIVTSVGDGYIEYDGGCADGVHCFRHATEEEIAQEKERRFWAKHGREVNDYRKGDILKNRFGFLREVHDIKKEYNGDGVIQLAPNYTLFSRDDIAEGFSVVTFAEDRLDVGGGH